MQELARDVNSKPLPVINDKFGLRLPPEKYCLSGLQYQPDNRRSGPHSDSDINDESFVSVENGK